MRLRFKRPNALKLKPRLCVQCAIGVALCIEGASTQGKVSAFMYNKARQYLVKEKWKASPRMSRGAAKLMQLRPVCSFSDMWTVIRHNFRDYSRVEKVIMFSVGRWR